MFVVYHNASKLHLFGPKMAILVYLSLLFFETQKLYARSFKATIEKYNSI